MAFGESPEDAREQQTSEAASESETLTQHTGESDQTDTVAPTNATDNISAGDLPAEQSKQEQRSSGEKLGDVIGALVANTGGLTESGRAVNDPRIMPKPIKETILQTEQLQLFALPEAPPVSVINRDVPRASNDPRGPRAALSRGE
jgi:ribonuclease E